MKSMQDSVMIVGEKGLKQRESVLPQACPWFKRVGFYGFLFFLIKGLAWLLGPSLLLWFGLGG